MYVSFEIRHLSGSLAGRSQRVSLDDGESYQLGRDPASDVRYDEELDDSVSAVHARIVAAGGRLYVEDQRSSNGTYLNGAPCPPFQRIAIADGSRLRLAREGPELQLTADPIGAVGELADRKPLDGADGTVAEKPTATGLADKTDADERGIPLLAVAAAVIFAVLALAALGAFAISRWRAAPPGEGTSDLAPSATSANVWAAVEERVAPAIAHVRCTYNLKLPFIDRTELVVERFGGRMEGSGVLVEPGLILTSAHVVEPWRSSISGWSELAELGVTAERGLLEVQFPGRHPVTASLVAVSEARDLALLSIAPQAIQPVPLAAGSRDVEITEPVAILGYPPNSAGGELLPSPAGAPPAGEAVARPRSLFFQSTVARPVIAGSRVFEIGTPIDSGTGGWPVLDRQGVLIGLLHQDPRATSATIELFGREWTRQDFPPANRAVGPEGLRSFLQRAGAL